MPSNISNITAHPRLDWDEHLAEFKVLLAKTSYFLAEIPFYLADFRIILAVHFIVLAVFLCIQPFSFLFSKLLIY
jgi:hypothetical protein